ncbi:MAG: Ig-like domain-containing protein, partial [Anaerolineae bacterium]
MTSSKHRISNIQYPILLAGLVLAASLLILGACGGPSPTPPPPTATPAQLRGELVEPPTAAPMEEGPVVKARPSPTAEVIKPPAPAGVKLASLAVFPEVSEPLMVVTTQPADGAEGVAIGKDEARIVVQFNHPVVPLVSIEEQARLPSPISLVLSSAEGIEPAVEGKGQWLNTSTYEFAPTQDLRPSTRYTVKVQAGLTDILGAELTDGYTFSFVSAFPAVAMTYPEHNSVFAGATQPVTVTFNQAMDHGSAERAFKLVPLGGGPAIGGTFRWDKNSMVFTPDTPLSYDADYVATVAAGARAVTGEAATQSDYTWRFKTAAKPAVQETTPADGEQSAKSIRDGFTITFSAPMDPEKIQVTIQPTITYQSVWWSDSETVAHVMGGWLASEAYTVTIGAESLSRYGDPLGQETVVRFTTAPMDPRLFLNTTGDMGLYNAYQTPRVFATFINLDRIDFSLYTVDRGDFMQLLGPERWRIWEKYLPPSGNLVREWSVDTEAPLNVTQRISTSLTADTSTGLSTGPAGRLTPGVYLVRAQSEQVGDRPDNKHLMIVSELNLALKRTDSEALVWATDLKSGQPVANQPIAIYNDSGSKLVEGQTDVDGVFRGTFEKQSEPWRPMFALSEVDGQIVAAVGTDWQDGIGPWNFNIPYNPQRQKYYANIYTDRPLYRPGQTVYFRGILRVDDDGKYSLPNTTAGAGLQTVPITVRDSQGKEISKFEFRISKFGTFNGEVQLSLAAPLGFYSIEMVIGPEGPGRFYSSQSFQVAAFRKPEFQVDVKTDRPEYIQGETITVDVAATYFFGGPVAGGEVQWRLLKDDFFFRPDTVKGFWDFTDYDVTESRFYNPQGEVVSEGEGTLGDEGKFSFTVPADVSEYPLSQVFTIDVEITDINNQAVANRAGAVVHKGDFYIGLRPQEYVGSVGEEQAIDVITVDTQGLTVTNQVVDVSFFQRTWYSVKEKREDGSFYWTSSYTDTLVSTAQVTTDKNGYAEARFTPKEGGVHRVVAEATDTSTSLSAGSDGNQIRSATYVWISSRRFVNWRQENNDRFELVADKKEYQVGDVAEILIPAPFEDSQALVTVERGTIRRVQRLTLKGNSEMIRLPIEPEDAPNIYVSVMLVKGTGPQAAASPPQAAAGPPQAVAGLQTAPPLPTAPPPAVAGPPQAVAGPPQAVAGLQTAPPLPTAPPPAVAGPPQAVAGPPQAVAGLQTAPPRLTAPPPAVAGLQTAPPLLTAPPPAVAGLQTAPPLPQFKIGYTNLQVSVREKLLDVRVRPDKPGAYQPRDTVTYNIEVKDFKGQPVQAELSLALVDKALLSLAADTSTPLDQAFYGQRMLAVGTAASLTRSADRLNQQLAAERKGGGGAELEAGTVRRDFRDTAYWNASVVTDENGRAQVRVTLPDNLTTWDMSARGVTGADTLVGTGQVDIIATKDVLVRPVAPRFVVVGDNVQLEAVVNNNTDQAVNLDVTLEAEGLELFGEASQPLTVPARGKAKIVWQTSVPAIQPSSHPAIPPDAFGAVTVWMSAQGDGYEDTVELTLPVYQFSSPEVVATAGQVDQKTVEQIKLPAKLDTSQGELTVEINPSLAAASVDSLKWLESFPYECSEQVVSKFLPNVATYRALQELGLDRPELRANLETQVTLEIQRLYALQHADGGWGWWLTDESRPWLTAYALFGLTVADQAGFAVSLDVMDRAAGYLTDYLDKPVDVAKGWDLNQRAFIAYVLSERRPEPAEGRGVFPASRVVTLYDRRDPMSLYGKAFLALALQNVSGDQSTRLSGLVADFTGAAKLSATGTHWEEKEVDYWTMNTDTRTTAIVLMTLARLDPENPVLPNAVRWLMVARREGHWETTQETVWSVLALTDFMKSTGELQGEYKYNVELNGKPLKDGQVDSSNVDQPVKLVTPIQDLLLDVANELIIDRDGLGRLYYTANLRYFLPAAELQPLDRGIIIGRQYFKVDPKTLKPTQEI